MIGLRPAFSVFLHQHAQASVSRTNVLTSSMNESEMSHVQQSCLHYSVVQP